MYSTGTDIALPVSITLFLVGVMVLPIAFIVYCALKWTRLKKRKLGRNLSGDCDALMTLSEL